MTEKRKRGRPAGSGKGRTMKTFSVNMREDQIQKMDRISTTVLDQLILKSDHCLH
jgi:hypothetical protein